MEAEYLLHLVMSFKDDFWISSFLADCQRESNSSVLITVQTLELAPSACSQFDEPAFVCVDMHINNENNSRKHEYREVWDTGIWSCWLSSTINNRHNSRKYEYLEVWDTGIWSCWLSSMSCLSY